MLFSNPLQSCRLCDSDLLLKVLHLADTPAGDRYLPKEKSPEKLPVFPLSLSQCKACGHVQLSNIVNPSYLYRDYIYTTSSSLGLAEHFANYAEATTNKLSLKPGSFVVEIGSNDGTMLRAFRNMGMRVLGIDPAREIARKATDEGIPTLPEFFSKEIVTQISSEFGQADLIVANNVMANVPDVKLIIEAVKQLLAPGGVFVFETGYLKYLAEDIIFDNIYHEHIDYYSIRPLKTFFHSMGMQLFDVVETHSKGSSIRCFVGHACKSREVSKEIFHLIERENSLGYHTPVPFVELSNKLKATKDKLHAILDDAKSKRKQIAGFGASVGVTTVLHEFELGRYIESLLDDNPAREGLFSPGMSIPVYLAEKQFLDNPPDLVVILSWRYATQILNKHHRTKSKPLKFLTFFPEVTII